MIIVASSFLNSSTSQNVLCSHEKVKAGLKRIFEKLCFRDDLPPRARGP